MLCSQNLSDHAAKFGFLRARRLSSAKLRSIIQNLVRSLQVLSNACDWSLSFEAIGKTLSQQPTQLIGLTRTVSATELATVQSHFALPFSKDRDLYKALWDTVQKFSKVNPCLRAKLIALVQPNYIALGDSAYLEEYTDSLKAIERSHFSEHRFEEIENGGIEWCAL